MYKKLNKVDDIPESKTQLTQKWMMDYLKEKASNEDKQYFISFLENADNKVKRTNNLTNTEYETIDIKKFREEFCKKYFSKLNEKNTKKKENKQEKKTLAEELRETLK